MKIEKIELYNFGSYEDLNTFDVWGNSPERRIVIVGGKNGAGKTTLFTALQVGLYGHVAFGYKVAGKLYFKEIYNLINNHARMDESKNAYVRISFFEDSVDADHYEVLRTWTWSNSRVSEELRVLRNGCMLTEDDLNDFQNYLLHLIPPALLSLYFFDGEKIADYFLNEQRNNIKEALLVLSGNDTYEILYNNIRRLMVGTESSKGSVVQNYADQKEALSRYLSQVQEYRNRLAELLVEVEHSEAELRHENDVYAARGGVSLDVWKDLQHQLAEEEDRREQLNTNLKSAAANILPLIIIIDLLPKVKKQINRERDFQIYNALQGALTQKGFKTNLKKTLEKTTSQNIVADSQIIYNGILEYFVHPQNPEIKPLFKLSDDQIVQILSQIRRANDFDISQFAQYRNDILVSIQKSKRIREHIQQSSVENYEEHMRVVSDLKSSIQRMHIEEEALQSKLIEREKEVESVKKALETSRKLLETELKKRSVAALSDRVMLFVEELQAQEYARLVAAVEADMNYKFMQMIRKSDFVDHIYLDQNFYPHFVQNQIVERTILQDLMRKHGSSALKNTLKDRAFTILLEKLGTDENNLASALECCVEKSFLLPIELDQNRFSNGEKQILVMALYWAIMKQSHNSIPFIIDTPFARIDTEHRANITERFFKELPGQLFILSTNEELKHEHLSALESQIAQVYLLEYGEDKRTKIISGNYFGV